MNNQLYVVAGEGTTGSDAMMQQSSSFPKMKFSAAKHTYFCTQQLAKSTLLILRTSCHAH
jgi:hypothetical protein